MGAKITHAKMPNLRKFRQEKNLTQSELGALLGGVDYRVISEIEAGQPAKDEFLINFKKEFGAKTLSEVLKRNDSAFKKRKTYTESFVKLIDILIDKGEFTSQTELADWIGVAPAVITNVKQGRRDIPYQYYSKLQSKYGKYLEEIVNNSDVVPFVPFSQRVKFIHGEGEYQKLSFPFISNPGRYTAFGMDDEFDYSEGEVAICKKVSLDDELEEKNYIVVADDFYIGKMVNITDVNVILEVDEKKIRIPVESVTELYQENFRLIKV